MIDVVVALLPLVAAGLAVPQFLPQFLRLLHEREPRGVSWAGLVLTSINNCGWFAYFVASGYLSALPTAAAAAAGAGATALLLSRLRRPPVGDKVKMAAWAVTLVALGLTTSAAVLGTVLTVAAVAQLLPSVWSAYRDERPTGISTTTWILIVSEFVCWGTYGLAQSDPRLMALGGFGAAAGSLVLVRARWARRRAGEAAMIET